ncbi:uncharacterized protein An08g02100 [Aspergillus niger]|uniref:Contig An08c0070, genomic contig n=2 Tax=Aspergillus niger TaxID=5061 RepID=A2QQD2_ASPNC|nr:uncharacterized protein An08g02100 [Aspergillus niger]CAK45257.1 unnamed protein product [Aspergillus niger]
MCKTTLTQCTGSNESGRLTTIAQMRLIYSDVIGNDERLQTRTVMLRSLTTAWQYLPESSARDNVVFDTEPAKIYSPFNASPDTATIRVFKRLLHLILKFLTKTNFFSDFCNSPDRLAMPKWLSTNQDLLHAKLTRAMPTELSEYFFTIGPITWTVIQLSGQHSERRKWIHSLEQVHYGISVVALSNSHKYLIENQDTNSAHEDMLLFDSTINNPWFSQKPIILFITNKIDIFEKKLPISPLSSMHFTEYDSLDTDLTAATSFFDQRYRRFDRTLGRRIDTEYTYATDTMSMRATLEFAHDIMFQKELSD